MEAENRSTYETGEYNGQQNYGNSHNDFSGKGEELNKVYDECECQKGIVSIASKAVPITVYLLFKLVSDEHLGLFVLTVVLMSVDFWLTKNILGRKLVGLRWFTTLDENEHQKWCFESCRPNRVIAKVNLIFFWIPQIVAIIFWLVIVIINMITLSVFWVGLAVFSCSLLIVNFALFVECKGEHREKLRSVSKRFGVDAFQSQNQKTQT